MESFEPYMFSARVLFKLSFGLLHDTCSHGCTLVAAEGNLSLVKILLYSLPKKTRFRVDIDSSKVPPPPPPWMKAANESRAR